MIVDLMRNDLGRVCEYGTVTVPALCELRQAAGVWHLVSRVTGRLRDDTGPAELLRATFPPGSVTGAPKVQALRVISQLEATGREAYCGAMGLSSPLSGLELNVAIRTLETRAGRLWLGAGGGVVSDSTPAGEVAEWHVVALAGELQGDAVMDDAVALQPAGDAGLLEQIDRALLEHTGANPLLDVLAAAVLDYDGLDPCGLEQAGEREARRAGTDDCDLGPQRPRRHQRILRTGLITRPCSASLAASLIWSKS